jgi:hypothetical protein
MAGQQAVHDAEQVTITNESPSFARILEQLLLEGQVAGGPAIVALDVGDKLRPREL